MAQKSRATRLSEACAQIQNGISEIEALGEEIQSWHDSMEGTNLENTEKFSELQECADSIADLLDRLEEPLSELEEVSFPGMY